MTVTADLVREVERLAERLRLQPPRGPRAERAFAVATQLAEASGAPVPLPWIGEHVVGDQLAVLAHELSSATVDEATAQRLVAELRAV